MMSYRVQLQRVLPGVMLAVCLASCGGGQHTQWDDIDYSRIARSNQERENDRAYIPPRITVEGCVDDDLYNCKTR